LISSCALNISRLSLMHSGEESKNDSDAIHNVLIFYFAGLHYVYFRSELYYWR